MKGGQEVLARFNASAKGGIPWFVMLDATGHPLVTSDGPKGNIGFPAADEEIAHFAKMLDKSRKRLTDKDIEELSKSLTESERQRQASLPKSR
jgi:hypothetical protein